MMERSSLLRRLLQFCGGVDPKGRGGWEIGRGWRGAAVVASSRSQEERPDPDLTSCKTRQGTEEHEIVHRRQHHEEADEQVHRLRPSRTDLGNATQAPGHRCQDEEDPTARIKEEV